MAFENLTFFELHLHDEPEADPEPPRSPPESEIESESSMGRRLKMAKIAGMVGFSIAISVFSTIVARKVTAKVKGRGKSTADTDDPVLEITE